MTIKIGMTVRTTKATGGLTRDGVEDVAEGVKGTVLTIEGDTALVSRKEATPVYVKLSVLAGCKGRPLKAESLARALVAAKAPAVRLADEPEVETTVAA